MAFALRARRADGTFYVNFRPRVGPTRNTWLCFSAARNGTWMLRHYWRDKTSDGWGPKQCVLLDKSEKPDPRLGPDRWFTLTGRAVEAEYALWVDGQPLITGRGADRSDAGPATGRSGTEVGASGTSLDGSIRFELDYVVIWRLPESDTGKK